MADYAKFDKIVDSDDEQQAPEDEEDRGIQTATEEERIAQLKQQAEIDRWLKAKLKVIFPPVDQGGPPELDPWDEIAPRKLTDDERQALAMFMVINHFEQFDINIGRHHDILNLARQNRWLEEDPGTIELLCQLQRSITKTGDTLERSDEQAEAMLVTAINTLAAPPRAGCSAGYGKIFEFFALVSDPKDSAGWDARAKYVKKEYAAEALFDSLMPKSSLAEEGGASIFPSVALWCG
eukprot:CAMPEP_0176087142 /NCGR_PEP_ID=MMETSP0120_2-20121206/43624_1 /TAXON_ID=160619 /ORGANISM="Kryptoperidinium foliaceum, Strain CCMP 1326" /LENGTH=236 /DNA_ID=CAMNT_0017420981 /DNA_START=84 /DNA_END=791 /DNA_ORIENTATION=+